MSDSGGRKVPKFKTDEEAEAFLMQDLSDLDLSQFKRHHFEFEKKEAHVNNLVPHPQQDELNDNEKARGMPYTR